jgi:hypothetical protein
LTIFQMTTLTAFPGRVSSFERSRDGRADPKSEQRGSKLIIIDWWIILFPRGKWSTQRQIYVKTNLPKSSARSVPSPSLVLHHFEHQD